jgi:hypothetical protein
MDGKLRAYLKRQGVSDSALDKISRGEVPEDDAALRKGDPPMLEKLRRVDDLLREIQERLDRIEKADAHRASVARGLEIFNNG